MDVHALKAFLAVARERSFSRAAAVLLRSQPAVSLAVQRLEEELNAPLIDRRSRTVLLTEAGELLVSRGERVILAIDEAERAVRTLHDASSRQVIVGATASTIDMLLPAIGQLRQTHPEIRVLVKHVDADRIEADLRAGAMQFGVRATVELPTSAIAIANDELVALMPTSHRLAKARALSFEQLERETLLFLDDHPHAEHPHVSMPSVDAIKRAADMGLGVAVLPRRCALVEIQSGRLVAIALKPICTQQVCLLRAESATSAAGKIFLQAMLREAQPSCSTRFA
jgi:DNA-binding transcriptional LysR family regulator